ncbi:MAG: GYD domain-containing protein [Gemmatimonadota bacterium]
MAIYLWQASYTAEGTKGLLKDGGTKRRAAVQKIIEQAGGKLHAFYFAFGNADVCGIAEFPDASTAVGLSLAINASGAVSFRTTPLITPEEMDAATKKAVKYTPPGA